MATLLLQQRFQILTGTVEKPQQCSLQKWPLRGVNVPIFPKLSRQIYPECWSHPIRYSRVSGWTPPLSMTFAKIVTEDSAFWDKPRLGLRESLHQFSEITSTKKQKKWSHTKMVQSTCLLIISCYLPQFNMSWNAWFSPSFLGRPPRKTSASPRRAASCSSISSSWSWASNSLLGAS